jgi:ABC-type sugar transport system ATPase subunit
MKKVKSDRSSQEEAELLGERIAIMSKGKIRCCGTSLELKVLHTIIEIVFLF